MTGVVTKIQMKKSRPKRSYAFVHGDDGNDYWFSLNGVEEISLGNSVLFKGERNEKGFIAHNVHVVS